MFSSESIYTQPVVQGAIEGVNISLLLGVDSGLCHERGRRFGDEKGRCVCKGMYVYHADKYRRGERGEEWKR
jgi:hypothetical protein